MAAFHRLRGRPSAGSAPSHGHGAVRDGRDQLLVIARSHVARRLDEPLAADYPLAVTRVRARAKELLVDGWSGLLDLQEQRLLAVAALEQYQVDLRPDTSDADDLSDDVDEREAV